MNTAYGIKIEALIKSAIDVVDGIECKWVLTTDIINQYMKDIEQLSAHAMTVARGFSSLPSYRFALEELEGCRYLRASNEAA